MSNQSGRIVLITGGSSGIGFEMAKQMVAQQSTVIICGRSQEKLDKIIDLLEKVILKKENLQSSLTLPAECVVDRRTSLVRL